MNLVAWMRENRKILLILFIIHLPTQFGKFFFFDFSFLSGIRIDYLAPAVYVTDILAVLLIGAYWPVVWKFIKHPLVITLGVIGLLNVMLAISPPVGLYRFVKAFEWISLFAIFRYAFVHEVKTKHSSLIQLALFGFLATGIFELVLALLQLANKESMQGLFYFFGERYMTLSTPDIAKASLAGIEFLRPYGTFSHPNSMGGFYLLVYFFVLQWKPFAAYKQVRDVVLFIAMLLILLSFSKTAILVFLLVNLFIFAQVLLNQKCKYCGISRVIGLLVITLIFSSSQGDPQNIDKRITLIDNAFTILSQHPIWGAGMGNYVVAQAQFPIKYHTYFLQPVHNVAMLYLAEMGLVLGGAVIALLYKPVSTLFRNKAFRYCFAIVLLTGMLDHYWLTLPQNFLLTAVVFGLISIPQNDIIKKS